MCTRYLNYRSDQQKHTRPFQLSVFRFQNLGEGFNLQLANFDKKRLPEIFTM